MTKDYAKPSTTKRTTTKKANGSRSAKKAVPPRKRSGLVFTLVILVSAFAGGLYFLKTLPESQDAANKIAAKEKQPKHKTNAQNPSNKQESEEQRFKFYDILPESEVVAPKVDAYQFKEKNSNTNIYYVLQTGSFRSRADAEKQKAQVAFQGLKAEVNPVTSDNGSVWYRVSVGPYYSRSPMNSALDKLVAINIQPLVKKINTEK